MAGTESQEALRQDLRTAWHRYVDLLAPVRPALHGYCRRLAGNVWDAEDLVQDTLVRAFSQWGVAGGSVRNPRAYLLRIATNVWIDGLRRRESEARALAGAGADAGPGAGPAPDQSARVRDAGERLLQRLSPQERAAIVLKEAFDMPLDEIAELLATTRGAVKAALSRGRARLAEPEGDTASRRPLPSKDLLDQFIARFDAKDLPGLVALMAEGATAENPGNSIHVGPDPAEGYPRFLRSVVFGHPEWPAAFTPERERLVRSDFEGEPIVLGLRTYPGRPESLTSVFRFEEDAGRIARIRAYAFCPETLREVGARLGLPVITGLYRAPTPAPGVGWVEPKPETGRA
jgi:RNA polymerase sigma-70 factor (ECF subfamily)